MVSPRFASKPIDRLREFAESCSVRPAISSAACNVTLPFVDGLHHRVVHQDGRGNALNPARRRDRVDDGFVHAVLRALRLRRSAILRLRGGVWLSLALGSGILLAVPGNTRRELRFRPPGSSVFWSLSNALTVGSYFSWLSSVDALVVVHVDAGADLVRAHDRLQRADQPLRQASPLSRRYRPVRRAPGPSDRSESASMIETSSGFKFIHRAGDQARDGQRPRLLRELAAPSLRITEALAPRCRSRKTESVGITRCTRALSTSASVWMVPPVRLPARADRSPSHRIRSGPRTSCRTARIPCGRCAAGLCDAVCMRAASSLSAGTLTVLPSALI